MSKEFNLYGLLVMIGICFVLTLWYKVYQNKLGKNLAIIYPLSLVSFGVLCMVIYIIFKVLQR